MSKTADFIQREFGIKKEIYNIVCDAEKEVSHIFEEYKKTAEFNQYKVIKAFKNNNISPRHFAPTTGYGYSDEGRERLGQTYADAFGAQAAIVSPLLMSGTHAISTALFGLLRPGDTMLCITGDPYDTFIDIIRGENGHGSLKEWGIKDKVIPLCEGKIQMQKALEEIKSDPSIKLVHMQRSRGYDVRPSLSAEYLLQCAAQIKKEFPQIIIMTDNCYGEFVEASEPVGDDIDIIAGSLIKNAGGGFAPTGGYVAGKEYFVDKISHRLAAPGLGGEIGSYASSYMPFFQGLFMAPHIVSQALMGVTLISKVMERMGFDVLPASNSKRYDITQTVVFKNPDKMIAFIRGIQASSAVDGNVVPYPWDMPGYNDRVIMAAGTFVQGSSIELSADGPIREPYAAYVQGALTYEHAKLGIMYALCEMEK